MRRLWIFGLMLLLAQPAWADAAGQWIVVTAPTFREAVQPLCEQRQEQGLRVVVVQTSDALTPQQIRAGQGDRLREHLVKLCKEHKGPSFILLVGAVEPGKLAEPERKLVPTLPGTTGRMKGQPSDNGYGCLDSELLPTVAVGRFPARSEEEARQMVRKTIAFEKDRVPGTWRTRLTVLAGVPAFNPVVDRLVESQALARFDRLDPSWHGQALYHNASSRFCVPDQRLRSQALEYVQQGQVFTVYFGHSGPDGFYADQARYLDRDDWASLKIPRGAGVFFTFGCFGRQLTPRPWPPNQQDSYGLAAIRNPHGPVTVAGSHGICFAAMVQLAADGMFESAFAGKMPERLGDSWLALKRGLAQGKIDALTYRLLDLADGDRNIPQATQRLEHLEMFVLLGDPALRLPTVPRDLGLTLSSEAAPGAALRLQGQAPARLEGVKVRLTVERPVSSLPEDLEPLPGPKAPPTERDRVLLANHERANRFVLVQGETVIRKGRWETALTLPGRLPWPKLIVRAYAAGDQEEGLAVQTVAVQQPSPRKP